MFYKYRQADYLTWGWLHGIGFHRCCSLARWKTAGECIARQLQHMLYMQAKLYHTLFLISLTALIGGIGGKANDV